MSEPHTLVVDAPAKVNPFLRVLGRRSDGYHDLETVVLPISLSDRLRIHAHADPASFRTLSLELEVTGRPELTAGVPVDESNLALRAAMALAERTGLPGFAEIRLEKRVPNAAGLGGGSADAAAALHALNRLWACRLSTEEILDVAARVGSDVPALALGGPALAGGRGERASAVRAMAFRWAVLPLPLRVATRDAFGWWDSDGAPTGPDPAAALDALAGGAAERLAPLLFNDLEGPVSWRHPEIAAARRRMLDGGALAAFMTGSGPTVVGLFDEETPIRVEGALEVRSEPRLHLG